jgi:hypothetical protein
MVLSFVMANLILIYLCIASVKRIMSSSLGMFCGDSALNGPSMGGPGNVDGEY